MRALLLLVLMAGCYDPNIQTGQFACGTDGFCPSGFTCQADRCVAFADVRDLSVSDQTVDQGPVAHADMPSAAFTGTCALPAVDLTDMPGVLVCFDTETGAVTYATPDDAGDLLTCFSAHQTLIAAGANGFVHYAARPSGPPISLWNFASLKIPPTGAISVTSNSKSVLALAGCDELALDGTIDLIGAGALGGQAPGAPGSVRSTPSTASPGGGGGGSGSGGGGGGHAVAGATAAGSTPGAGQAAYGSATLSVVYQGSGGGAGGATGAGLGGAGGGAVVLLGHTISVNQIIVDASGGRDATASGAGGGGGGSAGSILISGDAVNFDAQYLLSAQGGSPGSGMGSGANGGSGSAGRIAVYVPSAGLTIGTGASSITAQPVTPYVGTTPLASYP